MTDSGLAPLPSDDAPSRRFTVRFEPGGPGFVADSNRPLLAAAELAGLRPPSACRGGTCRTCMCRLLSGQVRYRIQWPGLSAEEKAEGWILPCIAHAQSDLVLSRPRNFVLPGE
ncbi:MAG TPA: 2Fe-2S iron-sulfur cluster-binding protein [Ramlibacter sp.]|nr:2Fe-2S iron-sulfur cluster-binding protein [Ramlibacter sp.]